MADSEFDDLMRRMPEIANAVNTFKSEAVQREAFLALVASFSGGQAREKTPGTLGTSVGAPSDGGAGSAGAGDVNGERRQTVRRKGDRTRYAPRLLKDLDLAPAGKKSFQQFIDEKQPKSNEDKYAVAVYYLQHELGISPITLDHVASVFRMTSGWKEPANLLSGITTAASRKGTIDTKNFNDLTTTPRGRNFVEHELPPKGKK